MLQSANPNPPKPTSSTPPRMPNKPIRLGPVKEFDANTAACVARPLSTGVFQLEDLEGLGLAVLGLAEGVADGVADATVVSGA